MADGLTTQTASLATIPDATKIATDDAGAAGHVQLVKLAVSTDGSATPLTADNTNGLLVNLGANNDVTVTGTVTVDGSGSTQPVSGTVTVQDGGGSLTVDGTVAATQSGTWTVQPGNTANTTAWKVDASSVAVPVTDNAGSLSVDDGGSSLTVDGTVSVSGSVAVTGTFYQATQPVSIATAVPVTDNGGSLTVDNAGTFAVQATSVGSGTNAATQVTVTNSSTSILAARSGRRGALLLNLQTVPVYLDPSGGTATTSMFRLDPGAAITLPVTSAITGITSAAYSATGDARLHVVELY